MPYVVRLPEPSIWNVQGLRVREVSARRPSDRCHTTEILFINDWRRSPRPAFVLSQNPQNAMRARLKYPQLDLKNGKIDVKGQIYFGGVFTFQFALYWREAPLYIGSNKTSEHGPISSLGEKMDKHSHFQSFQPPPAVV
jgi:hypothetical protein